MILFDCTKVGITIDKNLRPAPWKAPVGIHPLALKALNNKQFFKYKINTVILMVPPNATLPVSSLVDVHQPFLVEHELKQTDWNTRKQKNKLRAVATETEKIIGIVQPNYIPWKGYFDMIRSVDEFILLDDVQYTHSWRNRNLIKTKHGLKWLTIPVKATHLHTCISEVRAVNTCWRRKHWNAIVHNYARAKYFDLYEHRLKELFLHREEMFITQINHRFLLEINTWLNISTPLTLSSAYHVEGRKNEKILNLCKKANATTYLTGPSAAVYLDKNILNDAGIKVQWIDYSNYPEYQQRFPPFEHRVSILDLVLNEGPGALNYLKPEPSR